MPTRSEKALVFILVIVSILGAFYFKGLIDYNKLSDALSARQALWGEIYSNAFSSLSLEAKSAAVYDPAEDKIIFSMHGDSRRPIASITKVMTAIAALEAMPAGTIVPIPALALAEEGDSGLYLHEKWTLKDLAALMLAMSSNDAAKAIALARGGEPSSFIEEMNKKAADLGLSKTRFLSATGLDLAETEAGAESSAADASRMIAYGYMNHKDVFVWTAEPEFALNSLSGLTHLVKNTNTLAGAMPGLLASKTGFTDLAGGNLAAVFEASSGRILSAAVLGSSREGRFSDMAKLIEASRKYADDIMLYADGKYPL